MSAIKIAQEFGEWLVWLGLEGDGDPSTNVSGFVIGVGATRDAAVAAAVADLEAAVESLQQPESLS